MSLSENDAFVLEQCRAPFPERTEKYSQDQRTSNKDKGKFFGSTAKSPAWEPCSQEHCLTAGCDQAERGENPKTGVQERRKVRAAKEEYGEIRLICWESRIVKNRL